MIGNPAHIRESTSGPLSDKGFTLLELLLALAVLTVLISTAVPSVTAILERQKIQQALQQVEAQLQDLRQRSIQDGVPYWFRYSPFEHVLIAGQLDSSASIELKLSEPITFGESEFSMRLDADVLGDLANASQNLSWSEEGFYFPDGSAAHRELILQDQSGRVRVLSIQELTGHIVISSQLVEEVSSVE